jgi:pentatricopeptide repeat protein
MRSKGYTFDGFAYCTVVAALVKTGRIEEADEISEKMMSNGLVPDLASYNTIINLLCKQKRFDEVLKLVDEIERQGLKCDQYTHTIIIHGFCKAANFVDAKKHLDYMNTLGFGFNLVAFNCYLDCLGKAGHIDQAVKVFDTMEVKDSFTCTILVHNLCRAKKFIFASKLLVLYIKSGFQILRATQRAVIDGLCTAGYNNEARKVKSKIWSARLKH